MARRLTELELFAPKRKRDRPRTCVDSRLALTQPVACDSTTNGRSLRKCPKVGSGLSVHQNRELAARGADAPNDTPDRSARLVIAFQNPCDREVRVGG